MHCGHLLEDSFSLVLVKILLSRQIFISDFPFSDTPLEHSAMKEQGYTFKSSAIKAENLPASQGSIYFRFGIFIYRKIPGTEQLSKPILNGKTFSIQMTP